MLLNNLFGLDAFRCLFCWLACLPLCVLIHVVIVCATKILHHVVSGGILSLQSDSIFFMVLGFPRLGSGFVDWTRVQPNCSIQLYCAMLSIRIWANALNSRRGDFCFTWQKSGQIFRIILLVCFLPFQRLTLSHGVLAWQIVNKNRQMIIHNFTCCLNVNFQITPGILCGHPLFWGDGFLFVI